MSGAAGKIVGIGLNRTGTTTLGVCLQQLGYHHSSVHHQAFTSLVNGDLAGALAVMREFDSFDDWPWPLMYRQIDQAFPGSRFILTKRSSPGQWYKSLCRLAALTGPTEYRRVIYGHDMPQGHEAEYIGVYNRHNWSVENYFRGRPEQLLVVSWDNGDGWNELCSFLGRPVPDVPFPHVNRSDRLEQMARERKN